MTTPSVTLRSVKNQDTGIDISVPRFQEEEAPLGGVSVLYEVSILTNLDLFKTRLHRTEDVVHFSIFKAYREIEDLSNKLNKKYPKAGLPSVPKSSSADKITCDEKVKALNIFMEAVAKNSDLCLSSIFTQFLGITSQRLSSISIHSLPSSNSIDSELNSANATTVARSKDQEVFPKMKSLEKNQTKIIESVSHSSKKVDLFEEVKLNKNVNSSNIQGSTSQGLFDEFEDDNLFSSKPLEKKEPDTKVINIKAEVKIPEPPVPRRKVPKPIPDNIDDSEIIIKDRKFGDVSLFENQDFGDYITKDEEALFLVTAPTEEKKKNPLLSKTNKILSSEEEKLEEEDLDDILQFKPLPVSPVQTEKSVNDAIEVDLGTSLSSKPVPKPRKKSLGKIEPEITQKPEVMPRKVFLNKDQAQQPKPATITPPSIPPKPSLPSTGSGQAKPKPALKPKPPPKKPKPGIPKDNEVKTTDLDAENANKPEPHDNQNNVISNLAEDLEELDILKYIEQEEKSLDSKLSLFD